MKFLIVFVALFAIAVAAPVAEHAEILKQDSDVQPDHYSFHVETSDGKSHSEEGSVSGHDEEHGALSVKGTFSYKDEHDGHVYTVTYVADEHGFQPHGEHLPQLPSDVSHHH